MEANFEEFCQSIDGNKCTARLNSAYKLPALIFAVKLAISVHTTSQKKIQCIVQCSKKRLIQNNLQTWFRTLKNENKISAIYTFSPQIYWTDFRAQFPRFSPLCNYYCANPKFIPADSGPTLSSWQGLCVSVILCGRGTHA